MPAKPLNTTEVSIQKSPAEASDEDSLLSLSKVEYATLFATFAGWALDGMNVMIFSFVIPTLISLWGLTRGQAGLLGTTALVVSACGCWLRVGGYAEWPTYSWNIDALLLYQARAYGLHEVVLPPDCSARHLEDGRRL